MQVFDLGGSGTEPARRVADVPDFYAAAAEASGGKELFRAGPQGDRRGAIVRHIAPIGERPAAAAVLWRDVMC